MKVLMVEDNIGDVGLVREALSNCRAKAELSVARDGIEALEMPNGGNNGKPDLILLDLNLPRMDGVSSWRTSSRTPHCTAFPSSSTPARTRPRTSPRRTSCTPTATW